MTVYVVITAAEAQKIRGLTKTLSADGRTDRHAIEPVALQGDLSFIVPLECLSDPNHAAKLAEWKANVQVAVDLKNVALQREVLPAEFKPVPIIEATPIEPGSGELGLEEKPK